MQLNSKNRKNFKQKTKVILETADNISKSKNRKRKTMKNTAHQGAFLRGAIQSRVFQGAYIGVMVYQSCKWYQ